MRSAFKWTIVGITFTVALLAAILIPLYCVERQVSFDVVGTNVTGASRTFDGFSAKIICHVEADNRNYFDVRLTNVTVQATYPGYIGPLATGELHDVVLEDRTTTYFDLNMTLVYKLDNDPNGNVLQSVMEGCSQSDGVINLDVNIHIDYRVWAKSGQRDETRTVSQSCPNISI